MATLIQPAVPCAPAAAATEASKAPLPDRVGPYAPLSLVASGGMGTVCVARRRGEGGFSRLYALKLLHPHLAVESQFVSMLLDEAYLSARIHHPNVVPVVDVGNDCGRHYLAMEYVEGVSLSQLLRRSRHYRPAHLILPILVDLLEGLHAAHTAEDEHGVPLHLIHRDVSPQNVLVGLDGTARIIDFGVAKARSRLTATQEGMLKGKLQYIAPEMLTGVEPDARADIWSAGVVAWSSLTARKLFGANTDAATMRNILDRPIVPPSGIGSMPPADYDAFILRALQRDIDRRYASAHHMAEDLRRAAMETGQWGSRKAIGQWVRRLFGDELEARRAQIRSRVDAATGAASHFNIATAEVPTRGTTHVTMPGGPSVSPMPSAPSVSPIVPAAAPPLAQTMRMTPQPRSPRVWPIAVMTICIGFLGGVGVASALSRGPAETRSEGPSVTVEANNEDRRRPGPSRPLGTSGGTGQGRASWFRSPWGWPKP